MQIEQSRFVSWVSSRSMMSGSGGWRKPLCWSDTSCRHKHEPCLPMNVIFTAHLDPAINMMSLAFHLVGTFCWLIWDFADLYVIFKSASHIANSVVSVCSVSVVTVFFFLVCCLSVHLFTCLQSLCLSVFISLSFSPPSPYLSLLPPSSPLPLHSLSTLSLFLFPVTSPW